MLGNMGKTLLEMFYCFQIANLEFCVCVFVTYNKSYKRHLYVFLPVILLFTGIAQCTAHSSYNKSGELLILCSSCS